MASKIESSPTLLPVELLELIIGRLSSRSTLQSCALVNSAFLYVAQQNLFDEVVLSPPKRRGAKLIKTTPAQRFLDTIRSAPHLATFVHSLVIECEDSQQEQPWLYDDNTLQHILPCLVRLSRISVNGKVVAEDETSPAKANLSWSSLSSTLRSALTLAMRSGTVVDLELGGFSRIPVSSVIQSCSQLKKLSLLPLYLVEEESKEPQLMPAQTSPAEKFDPATSTLEEITIKQTSGALRRTSEWLIRSEYGLNLRRLKSIHFTVANNEDHLYIANILQGCSGSLKHLELNPGADVFFVRHLLRSSSPIAPRSSPLTLEALSELRSLKINTQMRMYKLNNNRYSDPLPWIVSILSTLPYENTFATLELSLGMYVNKQILESISWMKLVNVLTSDRFSHFEKLILTFSISKRESDDDSPAIPSWVDEVIRANGQLSHLRKEGLLAVNL
ncbi:hypothetical protein BKA70DRAFT_507775 [Coprinopsis sp. MPI-PUGE-AT-0042]|nr:hypothetical protein BKA70DRAFT_507775 [Coprinopsis sp. MPI-PUGE-AT-0042]